MTTICDTGPIVAYLNRNDPYHTWAVAIMKQVRPPLLTCEAVLTEVVYFLREDGVRLEPLFQLVEREALRLDFDVATHWSRIRTLMARYERMDLADASFVVMSEQHPRSRVPTVDRTDFTIYSTERSSGDRLRRSGGSADAKPPHPNPLPLQGEREPIAVSTSPLEAGGGDPRRELALERQGRVGA